MLYKKVLIFLSVFMVSSCQMTAEDIAQMESGKLCHRLYLNNGIALQKNRDLIKKELISRNLITEKEMYLIDKGSVKIGMNDCAVLASWGYPRDVNRTITEHSVSEQWVYRSGEYSNQYVYFDDGLVDALQD